MDSKSLLLIAAAFGYLLVSVSATVDLSCQVQRTVSQPVTGGQCPDYSGLRLCPSQVITCTCFGEGIVIEWINSLFAGSISFINLGNTMVGAQDSDSATGASAVVTVVNPRVNITSNLTLSVTTTATVNASQFNNTAIGCQDASGPAGAMEGIFLFARLPAPAITTVSFTAGAAFTVGWSETPGRCEMVDGFRPQISPIDLSCMMSGMNYTCSYNEIHLGQTYNFTVSALNCGTQRGEEASVTVNLQAPSQPTLTTIPLYDSSGHLLEIESWATEVPQISIADGVDNSLEYIFTYDSGSEGLQFTQPCTSSSCQHTFRVTSISQVQQYSVSVAVRNVVGVGNSSAPVTVDSLNNVFAVTVDVGVPEVICQFQGGPVASANCTIEYGNDPTYLNLTNTGSSTGTNVVNVTIPLSVSLQRDTLYYYVVSTMGARMQGTFRTACVAEDLGSTVDTTPDSRCPSSTIGSVQIGNGTGCYTGLHAGSEANYSCSCGFTLQGNERRVCQSGGFWSGTTPLCLAGCSLIPPPPNVNGGILARNDCVLLEYNCPGIAFGGISGTLQYSCDSQHWSTNLTTCTGAASSDIAVTVVVIVVTILVAILIIIIIIITIFCIKLKNKVRKTKEQPGPVYAEIQPETTDAHPEMKINVAYGPIKPPVTEKFEIEDNPAYGSRTMDTEK